jgi:hypothetical protein
MSLHATLADGINCYVSVVMIYSCNMYNCSKNDTNKIAERTLIERFFPETMQLSSPTMHATLTTSPTTSHFRAYKKGIYLREQHVNAGIIDRAVSLLLQ